MSLKFTSLEEFIAARDNNEITLSEFSEILDKLNFKKLVAVLTKLPVNRFIAVKKWIKEVGRLCGTKIRLKISRASHKPYMLESGEIVITKKDFLSSGYCFFAMAHETAHFLLTLGDDYSILKSLDGEYPKDTDGYLRSPVEYCANILTLMIFERCIPEAPKDRLKKKIEKFSSSLKEQCAAGCKI